MGWFFLAHRRFMMDISNKAVLITGCSSGIGYCVAKGLHARGYRVFASVRQAQDVARLQAEGLHSLQLDLADSASIQQAVAQVLAETDGKLYALFNNGAYGQPGAVEDLTRAVLRTQFETNFFGTHELTNTLLPVMRRQGEGRLIYNSSVLGFVALPYRGAYNASKYALEGLVDTLRLELALTTTNIHAALIEPGPITSLFRKNAHAAFKANVNTEHSAHQTLYESMAVRLKKQGPAVPFTLPPEAVLKRVIHALESPRPKIRYPVTFPTYLFAFVQRFVSDRMLDKLLLKVSGEEKIAPP